MSGNFKIVAIYDRPETGISSRVVANKLTRERADKMLRQLEAGPKGGIQASYSIQPE